MTTSDLVALAKELADRAHAGQVDKAGRLRRKYTKARKALESP